MPRRKALREKIEGRIAKTTCEGALSLPSCCGGFSALFGRREAPSNLAIFPFE